MTVGLLFSLFFSAKGNGGFEAGGEEEEEDAVVAEAQNVGRVRIWSRRTGATERC